MAPSLFEFRSVFPSTSTSASATPKKRKAPLAHSTQKKATKAGQSRSGSPCENIAAAKAENKVKRDQFQKVVTNLVSISNMNDRVSGFFLSYCTTVLHPRFQDVVMKELKKLGKALSDYKRKFPEDFKAQKGILMSNKDWEVSFFSFCIRSVCGAQRDILLSLLLLRHFAS